MFNSQKKKKMKNVNNFENIQQISFKPGKINSNENLNNPASFYSNLVQNTA